MECRVCGHKHSIWNDEMMEVEHENTKKFYRIEGEFTARQDLFSQEHKVTLYGCPVCNTVVMKL